MRLMLLIVVFATVGCSTVMSFNSSVPGPVSEACMKCICIAETGCKIPEPLCHTDNGSPSCGPFNMKEAYWKDARWKGGELDGDWMKCSASFYCNERAMQGYMELYAIESRLKHDPTCVDFARIHSGGPDGFKNPDTIEYGNQVNKCFETEQLKEG